MVYRGNLPFLLKNLSFCGENPHKSVRYIEVSAITKHRSAVVAGLSAKLKFSAKTVSIKPSIQCTIRSRVLVPGLTRGAERRKAYETASETGNPGLIFSCIFFDLFH